MTTDEGMLDPWVAEWLAANPMMAGALDAFSPEILELARGDIGIPSTREIASVTDETVPGPEGSAGDIPIRVYQEEGTPTGIVVYFHGGGFVIGSIGIMDNVARELAHVTGAVVVSVGYRLAPEDPFPAALDDCVAVTRWARRHADHFGVAPSKVVVAGESAGGNLSATVSLKMRDEGGNGERGNGEPALAAQVLVYPATAGPQTHPSTYEFDGLVISRAACDSYWAAYCGGQDLDQNPYAAPLRAKDLSGLPPALVVLGGCDMLRDEGREYAERLRAAGVETEEVCYAGQPHGFVNFDFPAAKLAFEHIGDWLRAQLS